jgi:hypothetical protein
MTAAEASTFAAGVASVVQAIVSFIAPIAQAIASFVSWKDVLLAVGIRHRQRGSCRCSSASSRRLRPVIAVFAALVLAIAALRTAFETNFLGHSGPGAGGVGGAAAGIRGDQGAAVGGYDDGDGGIPLARGRAGWSGHGGFCPERGVADRAGPGGFVAGASWRGSRALTGERWRNR